MKLKSIIILAMLAMTTSVKSQDETLSTEDSLAIANYFTMIDSVEQSLKYQYGEIVLKNGIALLNVPEGFKYLDGTTSEYLLTDIFGNPPSADNDKSLGMLIKENYSPLDDSIFFINITYSEDGYIDDEDAADIDYDELLETMQADVVESNEYRNQLGYESVSLIGWATPPFYDAENKKLHWAKELYFEGSEGNTLNYNIRILGRKGYLELNAIGGMYSLEDVNSNIQPILGSVNFMEGNQYADFNPEIDEVAAYGIGGLIAGKILAKAGLLAKFGIFFAKFWKFILIGIAAIGAGIKKFFSGKKEAE